MPPSMKMELIMLIYRKREQNVTGKTICSKHNKNAYTGYESKRVGQAQEQID